MNELSCRKVSDLPCAAASRGPIAVAATPSPASSRNPRRVVASMPSLPVPTIVELPEDLFYRRCSQPTSKRRPSAAGQHAVDHCWGGAKVIGGIGQRPQFFWAERAGDGWGLDKHIEERPVGFNRDAPGIIDQ